MYAPMIGSREGKKNRTGAEESSCSGLAQKGGKRGEGGNPSTI